MDERFEEAVRNKSHLFIKNFVDKNDIPTDWSEYINFFHHQYQQRDPIDWETHKEEFMKGGRVRRGFVQIWGYATMFIENPNKNFFPKLPNIWDKAEESFGRTIRNGFAIINLSSSENITNKHNDVTHNLYVQTIGSVVWKVYDYFNNDETYSEYHLEPGDAVWVPANVMHEVIAEVPRSAITVQFAAEEHELFRNIR